MEKAAVMWWFMILRKAVWLFFEAKYSKTLETMDTDCQKALDQINEKMYAKEYEDDFDHIFVLWCFPFF